VPGATRKRAPTKVIASEMSAASVRTIVVRPRFAPGRALLDGADQAGSSTSVDMVLAILQSKAEG
jgi:hypothetical protein